VVGVIDCVVTCVFCALVRGPPTLSITLSVVVGVAGALVLLVLLVLLIVVPMRQLSRWRRGYTPRFPGGSS
jgi:hypothetical protein